MTIKEGEISCPEGIMSVMKIGWSCVPNAKVRVQQVLGMLEFDAQSAMEQGKLGDSKGVQVRTTTLFNS